jgi:hypothetical protein
MRERHDSSAPLSINQMKRNQTDGGAPAPVESFSQWVHTWRYLFGLIGLVALSVLFYAEEDWRGERAWRLYKERMAARGESLESADFIPTRVPDEDNFAMTPALAPLFGFAPGSLRWNTNMSRVFASLGTYDAAAKLVKPRHVAVLNSWVREPTDLALWAAAFAAGTNYIDREPLLATNFNAQDGAASVLQALAEYAPLLEELRQASRRPRSRFNIHYEDDNPAGILLPHLGQIKRYCQLVQLRASAELALGRTEDALNDVGLLLYLVDASREEPILISHLVRMSELYLALQPLAEGMGKWSEPQLRALQQRLQQFDFCADMRRALQAERALFEIGIIEWVRRSPDKIKLLDDLQRTDSNASGELWPIGVLLTAAPEGWLYLEERNQCRAFDQYLLPALDLTNRVIRPGIVRESEAALNRLSEGSPASRFLHHRFFAGLMLPSLSHVAQKAAFTQTAVDSATLACGLERYRLAHGEFPDSLEKLSPDFIAQVPHDIITGQPLKYRLNDDGHYILYSVGWNEKDDGGQPHRNKSGELDQKEGDWVWAEIPKP